MSAIPQPEPGGDTGRVRCLYCGANNFPASASCWQCSRPLKAMRPAEIASASPALPPSAAPQVGIAGRTVPAESALAPKAAAALGMLFPFIGLPVGMVFLMLDDPRKTQLGWLLIGWSVAGTVLSVLSLAVTLGPLLGGLKGLMPHPGGGGAPALPGLPTDNGEGVILLLLCLLQV